MISPTHLEILKQLFRLKLMDYDDLDDQDLKLPLSHSELLFQLQIMKENGLVLFDESEEIIRHLQITDRGRSNLKVVLTGGAYDLIHSGHLKTLREAASNGNFLVVVVARDLTVRKRKRNPIHDENQRMELLNELKIVNLAILGHEDDHMIVVNKVKPDVVAIGSDQDHRMNQLKQQMERIGLANTEIVRLSSNLEGLSTTEVIQEILERFV